MEEFRVSKRPRDEETLVDCEEFSKKQKPFNHILSLLEAEEDEPTQQDLSPLITTLQQEITPSASNSSATLILRSDQENDLENSSINNTNLDEYTTTSISFTTPHSSNCSLEVGEGEDDKERVMRHLLEASDDELGIPSTSHSSDNGLMGFEEDYGFINGGNGFSSLCDELWELEDETANYYTLLQSDLFL